MTREDMTWLISQLQGDGYITEQPTLRDKFAMAALTGMLAGHWTVGIEGKLPQDVLSGCAYLCADAMLKARNP